MAHACWALTVDTPTRSGGLASGTCVVEIGPSECQPLESSCRTVRFWPTAYPASPEDVGTRLIDSRGTLGVVLWINRHVLLPARWWTSTPLSPTAQPSPVGPTAKAVRRGLS